MSSSARAAAILGQPSHDAIAAYQEAASKSWAVVAPPAIPARLIYPTGEVKRLLSISHATLYRLLRSGDLTAIKVGSRTGVTHESIQNFLATRPRVYPA
jgi:excisionase family DNA binding protein